MAVDVIHGKEQLGQGDSKYPYLVVGPFTGWVYLVLGDNKRVSIRDGRVWDNDVHREWESADKSVILSNV